MGLVWELDLNPNHKLTLLAYADHADHMGKNIFPSVSLISFKTGYSERSVQRITRELEEHGYMIPDGTGRNGTNRWRIPLDMGGVKIAPLTSGAQEMPDLAQGGDIPSGDIPSGVILSPESNNHHEPSINEVIDSANAEVDQILAIEEMKAKALANKKTYLNREKFTETDWPYCDAFVKGTGMKPLQADIANWTLAFQDWHQLGATVGDIIGVINKATDPENGFAIGSPHSLTRTLNRTIGQRSQDTSEAEDPEQSAWAKFMEARNG